MKKETRDTVILLVVISVNLACGCGLLIAELAGDIPAGFADVRPWRYVGDICSIISVFIFRSLWKRLPKKS
ncbi:MAG: hypothetical protein ACI361_00960 [Atopobiaceae bacterium]